MNNWEHSLLSKEGLCFLLHQVLGPSRRAKRMGSWGDQRAGPLAAVGSLGWRSLPSTSWRRRRVYLTEWLSALVVHWSPKGLLMNAQSLPSENLIQVIRRGWCCLYDKSSLVIPMCIQGWEPGLTFLWLESHLATEQGYGSYFILCDLLGHTMWLRWVSIYSSTKWG